MTLPLDDRYAPRVWDKASTVRSVDLHDGSKKDRFDTVDFYNSLRASFCFSPQMNFFCFCRPQSSLFFEEKFAMYLGKKFSMPRKVASSLLLVELGISLMALNSLGQVLI